MRKYNVNVNGTAYEVTVEEVKGGAAPLPQRPPRLLLPLRPRLRPRPLPPLPPPLAPASRSPLPCPALFWT